MHGSSVKLRRVCPRDAHMILQWENDAALWAVTEYPGPFSRKDIEQFIALSGELTRHGQERWIICLSGSGRPVGALDFFSPDPEYSSCGVGILIGNAEDRNRGYAKAALEMGMEYLMLRGFFSAECLIFPDNQASIRLFESAGFHVSMKVNFKNKTALKFKRTLNAIPA
jgi:diamine N-acetyltransferase